MKGLQSQKGLRCALLGCAGIGPDTNLAGAGGVLTLPKARDGGQKINGGSHGDTGSTMLLTLTTEKKSTNEALRKIKEE